MRFGSFLFISFFALLLHPFVFHNSAYASSSTDTMVGYWKFDETTQGANAVDSSGDGNTGIPHGTGSGPQPSTDVPTTVFTNNRSATFNGSDQYTEIANSSSLNPTGAVTISAWIKLPATDANYHTIAGKWYTGVHQQYLIQINNNKKLGFWTGDGNTCADNLESTNTIAAGSWIHIAAVQSGTTKTLYINGSQDTTKTSGCSLGASTALFGVGSKWNASSQYFEFFNGKIDDVRVYSRALSSTEISDLGAGKHTTATWTGGTSTSYETSSNWNISAIPDLFTNIIIANAGLYPLLTGNVSLASLTINSGSVFNTNCFTVTYNDSGVLTNNGFYSSACSTNQNNAASPTGQTCTAALPLSSPNLFTLSGKKDSVTLFFVPLSGENTDYVVSYGLDEAADMYSVKFSEIDRLGVQVYTVNSLFPGTWYFKIRGHNICMPGTWSKVLKVRI